MNREEWLESLRKRGWSDADISKARFSWNAGNRAGKEECAEICEAYSKHNKMYRYHAEAAADCADEIRETIK